MRVLALLSLGAVADDCAHESVNFRLLLGDETGFMRYPAFWEMAPASDVAEDRDGFGAVAAGDDGVAASGNVTLDAGTDSPLPPICAAPGEYHLTVSRPAASCGVIRRHTVYHCAAMCMTVYYCVVRCSTV